MIDFCVNQFDKMMKFLIVFAFFLATICHQVTCKTFKIGAIFDKNSEFQERAFNVSIRDMNHHYFHRIEGEIERIPLNDPFQAMAATCRLIEKGVVGILGPSSEDNSNMVQSICDEKEIPLLDVRWDDQPLTGTVINIYPYQNVLTQVYADILQSWQYKNFVILYENNESLKRVGKLLNVYNNMGYQIVIRQLDKNKNGNYRPVLKEIWKSGAKYFLLDCSRTILEEVLKQMQQIGLITKEYYYIITNLDMHTIDLTPFQYSETNITGMRFIDPERQEILDFVQQVFALDNDFSMAFTKASTLHLDLALVNDALMMFGAALQELPNFAEPPQISCSKSGSWIYGSTMVNLIKGLAYPGLTGVVKFDTIGYRTDFGLEVYELREGGITKVGNWTTRNGLNISRIEPTAVGDSEYVFNKTIKVIICETPPYAMLKETSDQLQGNDRFEGFGIDLIYELSQMIGFNYTFILREDKANGKLISENPRIWDGMLGDVQSGVADLAIADLTITADRQRDIDFTTPFMNLGISILYQKAKKAPPGFFTFADPFAYAVWQFLALAYFGVSVTLYVLGRICPAEWTNPYPCIEEPDYLVNQLTFANSLWFATGSIMQQGSEIAPIAISTRVVAGTWWFFTLLIVSSYTANLAAVLAIEGTDPDFNDVHQLVQVAKTKNIKFGAKAGGATEIFFREKQSQSEDYAYIYNYMQEHKDEVMVRENLHGVLKAQNEKYAFFMESTSIEYEEQRRCDLTGVGGPIDEKGYGIAMKQNSSMRNILNTSMLKLTGSGLVDQIKRKWWEERRGGGQCPSNEEATAATPLSLKNVGGVFWVTVGGTVLAIATVFIEVLVHVIRKSARNKIPWKQALKEEMKFIFKFSGRVKPVFYKSSKESSKSRKHSYDVVNANEIGFKL